MRSSPFPIGKLSDHIGQHWINLHCTATGCGHSHTFDPLTLAEQLGRDYPLARLVQRMNCTRCGHRGAHLTISPSHLVDGSDRPRALE